MIVFRLTKQKYASDMSGKGAEKVGGRWNSRGIAVTYTSDSRALCMAEVAVHTPLGILPEDYYLVSIRIPDELKITSIEEKELPHNWRNIPYSRSTKLLVDQIILKNKAAIIKVPSAVVDGDYNYLINPMHKDSNKIEIIKSEKYTFDNRLFKR